MSGCDGVDNEKAIDPSAYIFCGFRAVHRVVNELADLIQALASVALPPAQCRIGLNSAVVKAITELFTPLSCAEALVVLPLTRPLGKFVSGSILEKVVSTSQPERNPGCSLNIQLLVRK